jgi:hypothetical protein
MNNKISNLYNLSKKVQSPLIKKIERTTHTEASNTSNEIKYKPNLRFILDLVNRKE